MEESTSASIPYDGASFEAWREDIIKSTGSHFLFTVIMSIYNREEYLAKAVESVLAQTIGFEENIQLILVDDGSTDGSTKMCEAYAKEHPRNILMLQEENSGVSAARNLGYGQAQGVYINYLDSDDTWDPTVFEEVARFFFAHPDVPLASFKMLLEGSESGEHVLNGKFDRTRVIDIKKDFDLVQLSAASAFIARGKIPHEGFDTRLSVSEDVAVLSKIILDYGGFGVVAGPAYHYYKHDSTDSITASSTTNRGWYFTTPKLCHRMLFDYSIERFGEVVPYIQFAVMYDLQWRVVRTANPHFLSDEEEREYRGVIDGLLRNISDDIIMMQRRLTPVRKLYVLAEKHGIAFPEIQQMLAMNKGGIELRCGWDDGSVTRMAKAERSRWVNVKTMEVRGGRLHIEGSLDNFLARNRLKLYLCDGKGEQRNLRLFSFSHGGIESSFFEEGYFERHCFAADIPLNDAQVFRFVLEVDGTRYPGCIRFSRLSRMSKGRSYHYFKGYLATFNPKTHEIAFVRKSFDADEARHLESGYIKSLPEGSLSDSEVLFRSNAIEDRAQKNGHQIWLISDRILLAYDNGIALFRYLRENPPEGVDPYFVLSSKSEQFAEISKLGNVIDYTSDEYIAKFLIADKVLSSAADYYVTSPFEKTDEFMCTMYSFDFIFLQHGIMKSDMSAWLNKWNKNIRLFVTSAERESQSIIDCDYRYTEDDIALTGLARHDLLDFSMPAMRKILLMPTWRDDIAGKLDASIGVRIKNPDFCRTEYFKHYDALINDPRLLKVLHDEGYSIDFVLHPALTQEADAFHGNDCVTVKSSADYRSEFEQGAMLITDYSSVAFDFALSKRPIIYYQFDRDDFFTCHSLFSIGYFDYSQDGFGPVVQSHDELVGKIIETIHAGCINDPMYIGRSGRFYFVPKEPRRKLIVDRILECDKADCDTGDATPGSPKISVIIPVYNGEHVIENAIASVASQSLRDIEIVIVDDASTDGTAELLARAVRADSRIRVITHDRNRQAAQARRTGVLAATGEYIMFVDADDIMLPDACERLYAQMASDPVDILHFGIDMHFATEKSEREKEYWKRVLKPYPGKLYGSDIFENCMFKRLFTWNLYSKMYRASVCKRAAKDIVEEIQRAEDVYFSCAITLAADSYRGIPDIVCYQYNYGAGEDGGNDIDLTRFAGLANSWKAADAIEQLLVKHKLADEYRDEIDGLRQALANTCIARFDDGLADEYKQDGYKMLVDGWGAPTISAGLANRYWNNQGKVAKSITGSPALEISPRNAAHIGVLFHNLGEGNASVENGLLSLWKSIGLRATVFLDEEPDASMQLPEGIDVVLLPNSREVDKSTYGKRANALDAALAKYPVDAIVYGEWTSPILFWDMLVIRGRGISTVVSCCGSFDSCLRKRGKGFAQMPAVFELCDAIVVLSDADEGLWRAYNGNVFKAPGAPAILSEDSDVAALCCNQELWLKAFASLEKERPTIDAASVDRTVWDAAILGDADGRSAMDRFYKAAIRKKDDELKKRDEEIGKLRAAAEKEASKEKAALAAKGREVDKLNRRIKRIQSSHSFKVGKAITWIPRKIKRIARGNHGQ